MVDAGKCACDPARAGVATEIFGTGVRDDGEARCEKRNCLHMDLGLTKSKKGIESIGIFNAYDGPAMPSCLQIRSVV